MDWETVNSASDNGHLELSGYEAAERRCRQITIHEIRIRYRTVKALR